MSSIGQKFIEVLYDYVRIRDGAGYNAAILGRATRHNRFEILAEQNGWFNIKMPNGSGAWIEGKWVKKIS